MKNLTELKGLQASTTKITQTAHGFAVMDCLRHNGTLWVKAQADAPENSEVQGIVGLVTSSDTFVLFAEGRITGLSGLTAGNTYFLSGITAGALADTDIALVSKPVLFADSATSGFVKIERGFEVDFTGGATGGAAGATGATGATGVAGATGTGAVRQALYAVATGGTTTTQFTSGAPTITQGIPIGSITITPTVIGSTLMVRAYLHGVLNASYNGQRIALFKDGGSSAIKHNIVEVLTADWHGNQSIVYTMTTPSLTAITFAARGGSETAGTFTLDASSYLEVLEIY